MPNHTMKTRSGAFLILAIALIPSTASANAGTPLMWASIIHLVFGNAVIGIGEGLLLSTIFKTPPRRSVLILMAANYVSAWVGEISVSGMLVSLPDINIENLRFWFYSFVVAAFLFTLLIEYPFLWFALRTQERAIYRAAGASLLVNAVSYVLLFAWYWNASATSIMTRTNVVSPAAMIRENEYVLFFISRDGTRIVRTDMNGNHAAVLRKVAATHMNDRLFARPNPVAGYDLYIHLDSGTPGKETDELIAASFADEAPIDWKLSREPLEKAEGTWFNFGKVPSLASNSDWEFDTGFWASNGISGENSRKKVSVNFSLETPFATWIIRNATQLEGDNVVFQMGRDQICIMNPESSQIALLARGKGPIVAKITIPDSQPGPEGRLPATPTPEPPNPLSKE